MPATNEPSYTADWTTPYTTSWKEWLSDWIDKPNCKALEIGSHEGRSARWFCENILTGSRCRLDCVDAWTWKPDAEGRWETNTAGLQVRKHKATSEVVLPQLRLEGNRYIFAYVDGCHDAETVLYDLVLAWRMVCSTGVLIADDYAFTSRGMRYPPKIAVDAWLSCTNDSRGGYIVRGNQIAVWKR